MIKPVATKSIRSEVLQYLCVILFIYGSTILLLDYLYGEEYTHALLQENGVTIIRFSQFLTGYLAAKMFGKFQW